MKQLKPIIISAAVLLVVALGAFIAMKLIPDKTGEQVEIPPLSFDGGITVIENKAENVASIEVEADDGSKFAVDYGENKIGAQTASVRDADPRLKYNDISLVALAGYLGSLTAIEEAGEGEDSSFGFDKPQRRIRITFKDGGQISVLVGNPTPMGEGTYLRREDSAKAYIVGESTTKTLLKKLGDYRDIKLFHTIESTDMLTSVSLTLPGKATVTVVKKSEDEIKPQDNIPQSPYKLTSPIERDTNPDTIESKLLSKVISIEAESLVEDNPKDLSKYGLDSPVKLSFEAEDEISASLLIGAKAPSGGRYVMIDGVPSVILTKKDVDFEGFSYADVASALIFFFKSEEVKSVTYELNGKTHTFDLAVKEDKLTGTLDGKELSGKNPTNLFLRTVRFAIVGEASGNTGARAVKISARLNSGETRTLELYKASEREYSASLDGEKPVFNVNITEVRELIEAFDLLSGGKDIPDMF